MVCRAWVSVDGMGSARVARLCNGRMTASRNQAGQAIRASHRGNGPGLFVYGTLLDLNRFFALTGVRPGIVPASLPRHRRFRVPGQSHPAAVRAPRDSITGCLYPDLPAEAWTALDRYEGPMYRRCKVRVCLGGVDADAWVYLLHPSLRGMCVRTPWSPPAPPHGAWRRRNRSSAPSSSAGRHG